METLNRKILLNTVIFVCALISIVFDFMDNPLYNVFKPITTTLVVLLTILTKDVNNAFRRLLIAALCFCLLGDILLLKNEYFVFGLAAFLIGHLLFAKGFIRLKGFQKNIIILLTLMVIGIGFYIWLYPDLRALKYPVAVYVLVILFMAWQGIGLYFADKSKANRFIAFGVILFIFSDSILAINKFRTPFELSGLVILSTYWLAITLIANGSSIGLKRT